MTKSFIHLLGAALLVGLTWSVSPSTAHAQDPEFCERVFSAAKAQATAQAAGPSRQVVVCSLAGEVLAHESVPLTMTALELKRRL